MGLVVTVVFFVAAVGAGRVVGADGVVASSPRVAVSSFWFRTKISRTCGFLNREWDLGV